MRAKTFIVAFSVLVCALGATRSFAAQITANFDDLSEGRIAPSFTDGGITFSQANDGLGGPNDSFVIDNGSSTFAGQPGFTSPNTLGTEGYVQGPSAGFGSFQSLSYSGGPADGTSLTVFYSPATGNTLTLEAFLGSTEVGSDSLSEAGSGEFLDSSLSVSGPLFNGVELISSGSDNGGRSFIRVDTVNLSAVPEPSSGWICLLPVIGLGVHSVGRARWRAGRFDSSVGGQLEGA